MSLAELRDALPVRTTTRFGQELADRNLVYTFNPAMLIVDHLPDAVVVLDAQSLTVYHANSAAERLFGWSLENKIGTSALELLHDDDRSLAMISLESVEGKPAGTPIELRLATAEGWKLAEVTGAMHSIGESTFLILAMRDLSERRRWEIAHGDEATFRSIVQHSGSLLIHLCQGMNIASCSAAATRDLGHDAEELQGTALTRLVHTEDTATIREALKAVRNPNGETRVTVEVRLHNREGRAIPYQLQIARLDSDPTVDGFVVSGHDITDLDEARKQLQHNAAHDSLTSLLNRAGFEAQLEADLHNHSGPLTLAFIDLDAFKPVNDRYGHAAGDRALTIIAGRLQGAIRHSDYAGRIGGDEFAVAVHAS